MAVIKFKDPLTGQVRTVGMPSYDSYSKQEIDNIKNELAQDLDTHKNDQDNPHNVTLSQLGGASLEQLGTTLDDAKAYTDAQIAVIPTPDVSGQIGAHNVDPEAHTDIRNEIAGKANAIHAANHAVDGADPLTPDMIGALSRAEWEASSVIYQGTEAPEDEKAELWINLADNDYVDLEAIGAASIEQVNEASAKADNALNEAKAYTDTQIAAIPTPDVSGQIGAHNVDTEAHADIRGAIAIAEANANAYADGIKNDLLNGAGEAYDTLKELGDLINDNVDAIEALEIIATSKADAVALTTHIDDKNNPHGVTLEQLGGIDGDSVIELINEVGVTVSDTPPEDGSIWIDTSDFVDCNVIAHAEQHAADGNDPITPEMINAVNKAGDTMTGDLTFKKAENGMTRILKNHSTTADYGTLIQDVDAETDYVHLQLKAKDQSAVLGFSTGGETVKTYKILHTGNKDQIYTYGTDDLTAGTSPLETGKLYFVYE